MCRNSEIPMQVPTKLVFFKQILKYAKHISAPHLPPFLWGWINSLA